MSTKLQIYSALAEQTATGITAKNGTWRSFLDTAARLYKYSFPDQMMIYAQRPDATACAPIELWNDSFNRWIRRGSKGIALIDDTGNYPRIKYVFDVSDTEPLKQNTKPIHLWEMRQEHKELVLESLAKTYDDIDDNISDSFQSIAKQLAEEYYRDNSNEIRLRAEESFLEDFDDYSFSVAFENTLADSVAYTLMSRCGFDTTEYFDDDDFQYIFSFNTPDMAYTIGTATSDLSEQVLRDIELVIKKYERSKIVTQTLGVERSITNEQQPNLHTERGLSSAGHQAGGDSGRAAESRQIRENEESVSERTPDDNLQYNAVERNAVPAPLGNGGNSERENGTSDESSNRAESPPRQNEQPDGLDGGDEHVESAGGGNGLERIDLHVKNETPPEQVEPAKAGVFSSSESYSQLGNSLSEILSSSSITLAEVDAILRDGGNNDNHYLSAMPYNSRSSLRIAAYFTKDLNLKEQYLKQEYLVGRYGRKISESGKGFDFVGTVGTRNHKVCAWFTEEGVALAVGMTAKNNIHRIVIPWEIAAVRIDELMRSGQYISRDAFDAALENERRELADNLWHFYRDDMGGVPDEWRSERGGYPDDVAIIKSLLDDDNERQAILDRLEVDVNEWQSSQRGWHNPVRLLADMNNAMNPPVILPNDEFVNTRDFSYFITQDEIDARLTYGSSFTEGKYRILSFILGDSHRATPHTEKEEIDFLKKEYGHGGGTWSATDGWTNAEPGKGLNLQRVGNGSISKPEAEVNLKWNAVLKRTEKLILDGLYLTRAELDYIPRYERLMLVRKINHFYNGLPEEYERPFKVKSDFPYNVNKNLEAASALDDEKLLDFNHPHEAEWQAIRDFLDNPERVDSCLSSMKYIHENTSAEDRYYDYRKEGFEALTAFKNGTYTLFPGLENIPDPETAKARNAQVTSLPRFAEDGNLSHLGGFLTEPQDVEQMNLFDLVDTPILPSVNEQQIRIENSIRQTDENIEEKAEFEVEIQKSGDNPISSVSVDTDSYLLDISDENRSRITEQFIINPRSREAVKLVKDIYGDELNIPLPQAIKRISELVENNAFIIKEYLTDEPETKAAIPQTNLSPLQECERIKEENSGAIVMWQVGDFYEMYGEDAKTAAATLGSTIIQRAGGVAEPYIFTGTPRQVLGDNLKKFNEAGHSVAVASVNADGERNILLFEAKPPVNEIENSIEKTATPEELDFDTVAKTVLERVMSDTDYVNTLNEAKTRASLRNPCGWALEQSIRDHEKDEPEVFRRYFYDNDFNDNLYNYVLRKSWESRPSRQLTQESKESDVENAEPDNNDGELSTFNFQLSTSSPPPVFFVDWDTSQYDFDMKLYNDRDIVGYNKDGVQYAVGRMGDFTYITTTTGITSWGDVLGDSNIPRDIREQMNAYRNGDLTAEQVRENYIKMLSEFAEKPTLSTEYYSGQSDEQSEQSPAPSGLSNKPPGILEIQPTQHYPTVKGTNFRITDDNLGTGGAKAKFQNNIQAIKLLKEIENDFNRTATPEEQEILSKYVGWGALQQAFDKDNSSWSNEYSTLKSLLSDFEYEVARESTLNAHYTSPTVIRAIYDGLQQLGFKTGNILEPAMGVGNFFGMLPDSMKDSKAEAAPRLYGVELDDITGRIAKQLYPNANITIGGFEEKQFSDNFFDVVVGNVPFGGYKVADKRYDKLNLPIHDYFFAKSLDKIRPGGVMALITSKGTLDKQNPKFRKYLAERAELLGAIRLPNNAFKANAGTEVTSDIIFLKKRERPLDIGQDLEAASAWVHLGTTSNGIPVNRYFADNPEMMLGTMSKDSGLRMYGNENSTSCIPFEGADLGEQLKSAISNIRGEFTLAELDDIEGIDALQNNTLPADPNVKNFSYTTVGGTVYFRENSLMFPVNLPLTTLERIKGMVELRDCVQELISLQVDEHSDKEIEAKQAELNILYDGFVAEYGLLNSQTNSRAFNSDNSYYLLCTLEILDDDGNLERKADMFTKRTIKPKVVITHVDTSSEALAVSIGERACVDIEYMSELTGFSYEKIFKDLEGVIFFDFGNPDNSLPAFNPEKMKLHEKFPLVTADEYLSGNVREKLRKAKNFNEVVGNDFCGVDTTVNIKALEVAQPKDLDASEISVRLGTTWIAPEYVQQFMHELLNTPRSKKSLYQVKFHEYTGEWQVTGKGKAQFSDINVTVTYGTSRMNAYQIIDDTLNLRDVRVYDYKLDADGREKRVLNKKETTLAQQKQEQIKQAFKDWIFKDPERRETLVKLYNERFNSVKTREYDGSHITFSGISPEINLRQHQLNAIAHILYGGNTLLAHVVGAGKTFEMVAAAMETKRLGLCHKSLLAVPNHLTEQWAGEFLRLYPSANILVATKKDFQMRNRKKFCAKIATGDYDAVIIGHSQLEKIPMSKERQERLLREQLDELENGIIELKESNGERFTIKQLEKTKKSIETRLKKLLDAKQRDDVVTFEQLGVDRLFVDEAHNFKNLFIYTKMRNVAGLSTTEAQKSSDLFMKCRYMDEMTGNKGIIFATGTPISNSMSEMYTMQRYLQYDNLVAKGLSHFDCWASVFGETQTAIELAPEGSGYRARTRFCKFHNLPELLCMFREVADIQTADMLGLPVPKEKYETVIVEPSEIQKEMVQELSERAADVHAQRVDATVDNMLKITTDGRKIGIDQRLMNPLLPDFEGSKVNACTENVFNIWNETRAKKLTQLVFSDFSTPNKDGRFNIYDDIRSKLIERGVPEHEIAFIHNADTETKKKELFAKIRQGKVRILLGSTFKMGAGTNVQDLLVATHDVDCPWRPADLEQRAGRIVRQGNKNDEVTIFRYATNGTFDSYLWQTVEAKQKFISQIMSSKSPVRSCEDVDETALSYAEIKALCAGNPLIAEKMNLDIEVAKLRMLKAEHQSQHYRLEDSLLKLYPTQIAAMKGHIAGIESDIEAFKIQNEKTPAIIQSPDGTMASAAHFPGMTINGIEYAEKEPAAKALLEACKGITSEKNDKLIGSYMGFKMSLHYEGFGKTFSVHLRGKMTYQAELGTDTFGNITRINHALINLPKRLEGVKAQLDTLYENQQAAKLELEKPFPLAEDLAEKETRLALLDAELNIDKMESRNNDSAVNTVNDTNNILEDEPDFDYDYDFDSVSAKNTRPSFLNEIRTFDTGKSRSASGKKTTEPEL